MSRYGFQIEDTGHMYIVRTPSHIQIQWLHSSGLMILEASKASKTQGRGLCGEEGPGWGRGVLPGPSLVPGYVGTGYQARGETTRTASAERPNVCVWTEAVSRE